MLPGRVGTPFHDWDGGFCAGTRRQFLSTSGNPDLQVGCAAHADVAAAVTCVGAKTYSTTSPGLRWARELHLQIEMESGTPTLQ